MSTTLPKLNVYCYQYFCKQVAIICHSLPTFPARGTWIEILVVLNLFHTYYFDAGYEEYWQEYESKLSGDFIEDTVVVYSMYSQYCMDQGLQFIKNFYTPNNKSLYLGDFTKSGEKHLPVMKKSYVILQEAQKRGEIRPEEDIKQLTEDLCMLEKGLIFEWALSDGEYDLLNSVRRIITNMLRGVVGG